MSAARNIKAFTQSKFALVSTSITAAGAGDATEIDGVSIEIAAMTKRPSSVVFEIPCRAVLAATKTLVVIGNLQESEDGSVWTDIPGTSATLLTLTGDTGGSTETGTARMGCDVVRKDITHIRCQVTPDLNNTATDTAVIGAGVAVFGGNDNDAA